MTAMTTLLPWLHTQTPQTSPRESVPRKRLKLNHQRPTAMSGVNEGRNEIRFNNSDAKCLLENWVEERAVQQMDLSDVNVENKQDRDLLKSGHRGLLSTETKAKPLKDTTMKTSYTPPRGPQVRLKGARQEAIERMLLQKVSAEVEEEFNRPPSPAEMKSVTHDDFNRLDFVPSKRAPTAHHDIVREQPVTFWSEHREKIHGVSQVKTLDTVFRKNTSFSKPISESTDQPQPYELEMIPKM